MQNKNTQMTNGPSAPTFSLSSIALVLSGLAAAGSAGCAKVITYPETTPVYAEEVAPGVEPISVERQSVNEPTAEPVNSAPESEPTENLEPLPPSDKNVEPTQPSSALSENTEVPKNPAPSAEPASRESKRPATKPAATKKSQKKTQKKKASAEAGCGVGTCG